MAKDFIYQSDEYDRQTQRFIVPLFIKDDLSSYNYSSTGTLVEYNGHHYIIFAAHALEGYSDIDNIYLFLTTGEFFEVKKHAIGHQIFEEEDIVVVDFFNNRFSGKNYFNLNENGLDGFETQCFAWIGFPSSKSKLKKIHHTKSSSSLQNQHVVSDETNTYFRNIKYYTILSEVVEIDENIITGKYHRKNAHTKYKGKIGMGTHPEGMSGGAIYFFAKGQTLKAQLDDTFRFAGIGIEYDKNDNSILGVAREKVITLLDQFDRDNPLQFRFLDSE